MNKLYLSILYVVLLSILISGTILLSKPKEINSYKNTYNRGTSSITTNNSSYNKVLFINNNYLRKEEVKVSGNTSDIDLNAYLIEDMSGQVSLNLKYKIDGKFITKKIDTSQIVEIRNLFNLRKKFGDGYRISNTILNKKANKVYFLAEMKKTKNYSQTAIYSYNLENSEVERIFYDIGEFSKFFMTQDGTYNAFSYKAYSQNISSSDKSVVVIMRCSDNKIVLNSNNDIIVHSDSISNFDIYSYNFIKWKNNTICELSQEIRAKDNLKDIKRQTISYNTNEMMSIK